jgi:hypothetical protein
LDKFTNWTLKKKWQVKKFNSYLLSINNKNQYLWIQYHTYKINLAPYHKIIKNGVTLPTKFQKRAYSFPSSLDKHLNPKHDMSIGA